MHDPERQRLIEVFSGHGDLGGVPRLARGRVRRGRQRGAAPSRRATICRPAGARARSSASAASPRARAPRRASSARWPRAPTPRPRAWPRSAPCPAREPADWLDAGQCRDCREPAFNYRPKSSAQYIAALGNFDAAGAPRHFRFGFIASSDNHFARPGTGYKQVHRRGMTESQGGGLRGPAAALLGVKHESPQSESRAFASSGPASTCSRSSARPRS